MATIKERRFVGEKAAVLSLFFVLVVSFNLAVWALGRSGGLSFFQLWTAGAATWLIRLTSIDVTMSGIVIGLPNDTWLINLECTAVFVMAVYAAFVIAYPARLGHKAAALAIGLPAVFLANLLRLLIMAWLGRFGLQYASGFHDYVWQVGFIMMVVISWVAWIRAVGNESDVQVCG